VEARPIALLKMKDTHKPDDKILCIAIHDPMYARYKGITEVEELILKEISHFFHVHKDLEGKKR
jgi:inorganic pyrophosphatase